MRNRPRSPLPLLAVSVLTAADPCCARVCLRVGLTVLPPSPVTRESWGGLRGRFDVGR